MRQLTYSEAINEALFQIMEVNEKVFVIGVGTNSPWYVGQTTKNLYDTYGPLRLIDTPVSENGITGVGVGAAIAGMRPIVTHARMDFMYYAMDQICNQASNWSYMFGGKISVPLTIRAIINRGVEQAAQHSQALQAIFMHIPGLKVVMPSNAYDAKGMLISAVLDDDPVIYIDDRWLYDTKMEVPKELFTVPLDKAKIVKTGSDLTLIASSYMMKLATQALEILEKDNKIDIELIDLRSISPIDKDTILRSVKKTGKLVIADGTWKTGGVSSEIVSIIATEGFSLLNAPIRRVTLPDTPAPSSGVLEKLYYPNADNIVDEVNKLINK